MASDTRSTTIPDGDTAEEPVTVDRASEPVAALPASAPTEASRATRSARHGRAPRGHRSSCSRFCSEQRPPSPDGGSAATQARMDRGSLVRVRLSLRHLQRPRAGLPPGTGSVAHADRTAEHALASLGAQVPLGAGGGSLRQPETLDRRRSQLGPRPRAAAHGVDRAPRSARRTSGCSSSSWRSPPRRTSRSTPTPSRLMDRSELGPANGGADRRPTGSGWIVAGGVLVVASPLARLDAECSFSRRALFLIAAALSTLLREARPAAAAHPSTAGAAARAAHAVRASGRGRSSC